MDDVREATMCYISCGDRTLMINRNKDEDDFLFGTYVALGGGVKPGEGRDAANHRELWEEGKISAFNVQYRGKVLFKHLKKAVNADNKKNHLVHMFSTDVFYKHGPMWECESGSLVWTPNKDIARLSNWNGGDLVYEWLQDGRFFDAEVVHGRGGVESFDVKYEGAQIANNPYSVN